MSLRVAAFTPMRARWNHPLRELTRGIRVIEKPIFDEKNWDFWNLRRTEKADALERSHWLCIEEKCEWGDRYAVLTRMQILLRNAMLGSQLWAPKGWDGIMIHTQVRDNGEFHVDRVVFAEPYPMSRWSKMMSIDRLDPDELGPLVEGTLSAFESGAVPLINPFQFLEIGLQTAFNHTVGGALFWIFGLDALTVAGGQDTFSARLNRLLGKDSLVFPEDWDGRRPAYTVGDVAKDIFGFRNQVSHGLTILEKHRKPIDFRFEPQELAYSAMEKWTQKTLIVESALFTLLAGLRKIITAGYMDRMKDQRIWGRWLDAPP